MRIDVPVNPVWPNDAVDIRVLDAQGPAVENFIPGNVGFCQPSPRLENAESAYATKRANVVFETRAGPSSPARRSRASSPDSALRPNTERSFAVEKSPAWPETPPR